MIEFRSRRAIPSAVLWRTRRTIRRVSRRYLLKGLDGLPWVVCPMRDAWNILRYGPDAPRFAQRIWVDPRVIEGRIRGRFHRCQSGQVIGGDWDLDPRPVGGTTAARHCHLHFVQGVPWDATGAHEMHLRRARQRLKNPDDSDSALEDIAKRYEQLDYLFEDARREGRLRTRSELPGISFRELDGIVVHIGRDGRLLYEGTGDDRFTVAWLLGLTPIPAQIGLVHREALPEWKNGLSDALTA